MTHWLLLAASLEFHQAGPENELRTDAHWVCGATAMKLSAGFSRTGPSLLIFAFYGVAFACLTLALARIEIGVAYAIWSGVGTALIAGIGVVFFGEALTPLKIASLLLIIAGVVGLNLGGQGH